MSSVKRKDGLDGVSGLKKLGVKDLSYKMVFIACSVHNKNERFGFSAQPVNGQENEDDAGQVLDKFNQVEK